MTDKKGTVLVTGATGFVASYIISSLSKSGYSVRGTVRDVNSFKTKHLLTSLGPSVSASVKLYDADLTTPGSFDKAVADTDFIVHAASPVVFAEKDPQRDIVDPAVNGTKSILSSINKEIERNPGKLKKFIYISSIAAVVDPFHTDPDEVYTEDDWNTTSTVESGPYPLSKRLAEEEVYKWEETVGRANGVSVISLALGCVFGPPIGSSVTETGEKVDLPISNTFVLYYFNGQQKAPVLGGLPMVSITDTAQSVLKSIEVDVPKDEPGVNRYLLFENGYSWVDVADWIREKYPERNIAPDPVVDVAKGFLDTRKIVMKTSNEKIKRELGIQFNPVKYAVADLCDWLQNNPLP